MGYFEWTWLNGNFSPSQWNVHFIDGPRTSNNLESWHSRVETLAGKAHLNTVAVVEPFKKEKPHIEASIFQLAAGGTVRSKRPSRKRKKKDSSPLLCGCYVIECIIFQIKPCNLYPVGKNYR